MQVMSWIKLDQTGHSEKKPLEETLAYLGISLHTLGL